MPIPLIPIIEAGSSLLGEGIGVASTASLNRKTRKWNEKMHGIMRGEALADFAMQNAYNHPSSQMARLREAGLNPNLVYGEGAVANNASGVRSAPVESWNPSPTRVDVGAAAHAGISSYYDTQMKQATIDNLRSQNTLLEEQKWKTIAETLGIQQGIKTSQFDLGLKEHLRDTTIAGAEAGVEKTKTDIEKMKAETGLVMTENMVKKAMLQPTIDKILQEIVLMRKDALLKGSQIDLNTIEGKKKSVEIDELTERIHNMWLDGRLKQFELDLKEARGRASDWSTIGKILYDALDAVISPDRQKIDSLRSRLQRR